MVDIAKTIAIFLTPIITMIGWFYVDRTNNKREDRKELYSILSILNKSIDELDASVINFFCLDNEDMVNIRECRVELFQKQKYFEIFLRDFCERISVDKVMAYEQYKDAIERKPTETLTKGHIKIKQYYNFSLALRENLIRLMRENN